MNENNQITSYIDEILEHDIDYSNFIFTLKDRFLPHDLALCYDYILKKSNDKKLLDIVIREINKTKYKDNFISLLDFVVQNNATEYAELKVLAIKTLALYKDKRAVNALLYCLNDKSSNYKIRLASADALGKIGDSIAFEPLQNIIYDDKEKSVYVKESALSALGMLGDNRAIDVFSSIINTKQIFSDKFSYLKERIIEALAKLDISKDNKAIKILKESLHDPSSALRINTIEAIMNSDIEQSYELILDRLKYDSDMEVRKNALVALYNISDRKILDEVIEGNYEEELKSYAQKIINEYEDEE